MKEEKHLEMIQGYKKCYDFTSGWPQFSKALHQVIDRLSIEMNASIQLAFIEIFVFQVHTLDFADLDFTNFGFNGKNFWSVFHM